MVTTAPTLIDALLEAGYSLRDAAAALRLSATDLIDAADSAAAPLDALAHFSRRAAELQVLDARLQALRALVHVCAAAPDLEKKRLAAQAILRFDPWRITRAARQPDPHDFHPRAGELSPRPHQRRAVPASLRHGGTEFSTAAPETRHREDLDEQLATAVAEAGVALNEIATSYSGAEPPDSFNAHQPTSAAAVATEVAPATEEPLVCAPDHHAPKGRANHSVLRPEPSVLPTPVLLSTLAGRAMSINPFLAQAARAPPSQCRDLRAAA